MGNLKFSRTHAHIGRSETLRTDTKATRAHVPADKLLDSYISDIEWACHRHKLVGEALRGMHELGVQLDDADTTARPGDLAALHAVFSEFTLILCAELDQAVSAVRDIRRQPEAG